MLVAPSRDANVSIDAFFDHSADALSPINEVSREPYDGFETSHLELAPYSQPKIRHEMKTVQRMGRWQGDDYFRAVPSHSRQPAW